MRVREMADRCVEETGAARISDRAHEVVLIAIATATKDRAAWKRAIKAEYRRRHPKCGSIFLIFILPVLISIIAQWLAKWLFKDTWDTTLKSEAAKSLGSSPE